MSDIQALESSSYWDYCTFLNNYLKKVDQQKEKIRKFDLEQKAKNANHPKQKSKR